MILTKITLMMTVAKMTLQMMTAVMIKRKRRSRKERKRRKIKKLGSSSSYASCVSSVISTQKAHALIKKVKSKLRKELGETSLKELKSDVKNMLKRVLKEDEEEFENIVARLMKLRDKINTRIDDLKKTNRKRNQCPKGSLPKWDGACDSYLDFRDSSFWDSSH